MENPVGDLLKMQLHSWAAVKSWIGLEPGKGGVRVQRLQNRMAGPGISSPTESGRCMMNPRG